MIAKKIRKFIIIFILVMQGFLINTTHAGFLDSLWWSVKNSFVNSEQNIHGKMLVWDEQSSIWWWSPWGWANLKLWVSTDWVSIRDNFIKTIIRYLLWIVAMITITVFIYTWFELFSAEWKQEVLKKSLKSFVYAAVWLAVIPLAFILVKITTWFSL